MKTVLKIKYLITKTFGESFLFQKLHGSFFSSKRKEVVSKALEELRKLQSLSAKESKELNKNKLLDILIHAYKTVPFYNKLFSDLNISNNLNDFSKIPLLTKEIVKNNTMALLSSKYETANLLKRFTGGSTGQPMEFYSDKYGPEIDNAHHWYLYELMGYTKKDIIIGCYGRAISENLTKQHIYWQKSTSDNVFGNYVFSSLYLNEYTISFYIEKILDIKPQIIRGYPSFLNSLAIYIIKENINLGFKVKGINLTAELCNEEQRTNIEKAFDTRVYFEYGHKEISIFCYSKDSTYQYFSSPAYCYVEILNEDGTETPLGEIGKVITTGFCNYGMPFIRYDTGDLAQVVHRNGGIVVLKKILGRLQDYLLDSNGIKTNLIGAIYTHKLKAFKKIKNWQLKQSVLGKVDVLLVRETDFTLMDELEIKNLFESFKNLEFSFIYVDHIEKTKAGKQLFVVQKIKNLG